MSLRVSMLALCISAMAAQAGAKLSLEKAGSLLARLAGGEAGPASAFTLMTATGEALTLDIEDFHYQGGYLSLTGRARGSEGSEFILKGTALDLYGWVVLRDRQSAHEYTTDASGMVHVEEIPLARIYPDCDFPDPDASSSFAPSPPPLASSAQPAAPEPHVGPYRAGVNVLKLQSLPGAEKVLHINLRRIIRGDSVKGWTKAQVWEFWQGFAAGLSMFDVNVTTDSTVAAAAGVRNTGIANMYDSAGTSSCGLNIFGTTRGCTIYRKSSAKYQAGTLIHEVGHMLGLSHDGNSSRSYFGGFLSFQWCPVMGAHTTALRWTNTLWQWSKGEYRDANQKQDDLTVMDRHLDFREDDVERTKPLELIGDSVPALLNRGQIAENTDADSFSFEMSSGGRAKLRVDRTEYGGGSMLDIEALILDAAGKQVARHNAAAARHASFDLNLPAGAYTLVVRGGSEGRPDSGFTRYSSLGFYAISGSLSGGVVDIAGAGGAQDGVRILGPASAARLDLRIPVHAKVREITLTSVAGRRVFESRERVASIDLSGLPAGYYGLRIETAEAVTVRRIAKF